MEPQDRTISAAQPGGIQFSFGTGDGSHSFTWTPPTPSNLPGNDHETCLNNRKRRRVQVDIVKQGVAMLQLGSDMIYDFRSTHTEAEKKLADVAAERDDFRKKLETATEKLQKTRADYRSNVEMFSGTMKEVYHYKKHHGHSNETLHRLQTTLDKATRSELNIVKHRNQLLSIIDGMQKEKSKNEGERSLLREKLDESLAAQEKTKCELDEIKRQLSQNLERAKEKLNQANLHWNKAEEEIKVVKAGMENLRDQAKTERSDLVLECDQLRKDIEGAKKNDKNYRDEIAQLKERAESLEKELHGCRASYNSLQEDFLTARQANAETRAELSETQQELDTNRNKYAMLIAEMRLLEERNAAQVTQLGSERCEHLREKREAIEKQTEAETEIERLRDENCSLRAELRGDTLEDELLEAFEGNISKN
ncbi:hypothetical protein ColTof4_06341 [Colletotrichum tofieldiae]|nr:hypothetical protein ColTof3_01525 [Colletotrichum tofieldiae]GKT73918.1 hypothetical protein ColTof4_06341 [Colletotrichum tofieldiae]